MNKHFLLTIICAAMVFAICFASYAQTSVKPSLIEMFKDENNQPSLELVQAAIKTGADVKARTEIGMTALMWAAEYNQNPEVITALIKAGADVNARDKYGVTALMCAAHKNKNPKTITALIEAGTDINAKDDYGKTALMKAASNNENPEVITIFVEAGAVINACDDFGSRTALMWAAYQNQNQEVVVRLLKNGADPKAKCKEGKTALNYANENIHLKNTDAYWQLNDALYK